MSASLYDPLYAKLHKRLARLPGLGPKSAQRILLHLLSEESQSQMIELENLLHLARTELIRCDHCSSFFRYRDKQSTAPSLRLCPLCTAPHRDDHCLCIVQSLSDLLALEKSHSFQGRYHLVAFQDPQSSQLGVPNPHQVELLVNRITAESSPIQEVILALPSTFDGQSASQYLYNKLHQLKPGLSFSRLGLGIPAGADLEQLDPITLAAAFSSRQMS